MKRLFVLAALLAIVCYGKAQNVQLHYDFGGALYDKDLHGRPVLTSTVEMFKADKWGSTYFFVDRIIPAKELRPAIGRLPANCVSGNLLFPYMSNYNGGASNSFSYNNAYLGGATYTWNNPDFTKGFTLTAMYKYIQKHREPNNFQLTGTWYVHFVKNGLCTFSGFADWWRERTDYADGSHRNLFSWPKPQFWGES